MLVSPLTHLVTGGKDPVCLLSVEGCALKIRET